MVSQRDKDEMVNRLLMWLVYDTPNKPGEYIKKRCMRNDKDREVLKSLTAKDFDHNSDWIKSMIVFIEGIK